jgi:hypothetical protein
MCARVSAGRFTGKSESVHDDGLPVGNRTPRVYLPLTVYLSFCYTPPSTALLYAYFNGRHDVNFDFNEPSSRRRKNRIRA